jgi:transcriptional regulator with XRE-family HTH domain
MPIGERIKDRRRKLGWTQEELARRLGVRQNVISRLEAGIVNNPSVSMIRRLARVLGVTADHLVGMYDEEQDDALPLEAVASG